jgi:hypothetical protein
MNDRRPDSRRDNRIRLIRPVAGVEGLSNSVAKGCGLGPYPIGMLARLILWLYSIRTIGIYTTYGRLFIHLPR